MHRSVTCVAILAISACHGDAPRGGTGAASSDGSGSSGAGSSADAALSACTETPIFPPRSTGDSGNDLYRKIVVDPATHDLYFSDLHTIYRVAAGGGEPQVVLPRAKGGGRQFWLAPDRLLVAGNDVWLDNKVHAVLFTMPRGGGDLQPMIDVPAGDVRTFRSVEDIEIIGDDVYWRLDEGTRGGHDTTHTLLTTSWTHPGQPRVLYTTKLNASGDLLTSGSVIAGGRVYLLEDRGKSADPHAATVIDLATGAVSQADPGLNGYVVDGDANWILVRHDSSKDGKMGLIRMRPDGSQAVQIGTSLRPHLATRGDTWALADHNGKTATTEVSVIAASGEKKLLGCVNGDATVHAIAIGDDAIYVSVFRNNKATILRFAR